jgi:CRP-like cAMP-binding protein
MEEQALWSGHRPPRSWTLTIRERGTRCPDCPGATSLLDALPGGRLACPFYSCALVARATVPADLLAGSGLTLVRRGIIVKELVDATGRATVIDVVGPGSALAFAHRPGVTAFAAGPALLCACPTARLEEGLAGPDGAGLARELLWLQQAALARMERLADARGRPTVGERVAALLCALADGLSAPRKLDLLPGDLRQRELGALLAIRHESVCRELRRLERVGVVRRTSEGLELVDRAALEGGGAREDLPPQSSRSEREACSRS